MATNGKGPHGLRLRSQLWFDNPDNPGMTALYLERYLNYGLTREELQSGKPIIGIAQTGSDLSPCNRHHLELARRVRDGIRASAPARVPSCGSRASSWRKAGSTTSSSWSWSPPRPPRPATATPWARP